MAICVAYISARPNLFPLVEKETNYYISKPSLVLRHENANRMRLLVARISNLINSIIKNQTLKQYHVQLNDLVIFTRENVRSWLKQVRQGSVCSLASSCEKSWVLEPEQPSETKSQAEVKVSLTRWPYDKCRKV